MLPWKQVPLSRSERFHRNDVIGYQVRCRVASVLYYKIIKFKIVYFVVNNINGISESLLFNHMVVCFIQMRSDVHMGPNDRNV